MLINLTQGQVTIISDDDADLAELKWCALKDRHYPEESVYTAARNIYRSDGSGKKTTQLMHRVILERMLDRPLVKGEVVDHINHNTLDNQRSNLRLATHSQNMRNMLPHAGTASGFKGISWVSRKRTWAARIVVNDKRLFLGTFKDPIDAARAYDKAAREHFGEFALTNFAD